MYHIDNTTINTAGILGTDGMGDLFLPTSMRNFVKNIPNPSKSETFSHRIPNECPGNAGE